MHHEIERKSQKTANIIELLYNELEKIFRDSERGKNTGYVHVLTKESPLMEIFFHFIRNTNYTDDTPSWRIITDYVAGMTDSFAERTFMQLFIPDPVV
jgi:dGTP triphosphohydrolase